MSTTAHEDPHLQATYSAVDSYTFSHLHSSRSILPTPETLQKAAAHQSASGLEDIAVTPNQGKFLQVQARLCNAQHILELDTLGSISSLFLVHATPTTRVTTIEYAAKHARVARQNFAAAGVTERVEVLEGSGLDWAPRLVSDVREGRRPEYDMVFIDADKPSNPVYFRKAVEMVRKGGLIVVDNVVRNGGIVSEEMKWDAKIEGGRAVIELAGREESVSASVLQTVGDKGYDGMVIAVKL